MYEIRNGQDGDLAALQEIAARAYAQYVEAIGKKPAPMLADFGHHLGHDTVFVAENTDDKTIAGYAVLLEKKDGFWLENIAVDPSSAGQGIGSKLVSYAESYLAERAKGYQLYTNVKMVKNIDWYGRLGFTEVGRRVESGFERVYFQKDL